MAIQDKPYDLHLEKEILDSFLSTIEDSSPAPQDEAKADFTKQELPEQEEHKFEAEEPEKEKADLSLDITESPAIQDIKEPEYQQDAIASPAEERAAPDYAEPAEPLPPVQDAAPLHLEEASYGELKPEQAPVQVAVTEAEETPAPEEEKEAYPVSGKDDEYRTDAATPEIRDQQAEPEEPREAVQQDVPETVPVAPVIAHEDRPQEEPDHRPEEPERLSRKPDIPETRLEAETVPEKEPTVKIMPPAAAVQEQKPEDDELPAPEKEATVKQETARPARKVKKASHWGMWVRAGILFAVFAAIIQGYLFMNPEVGEQSVHWLTQNVPGIDKVLNVEQPKRETAAEKVKFTNVRQRNVANVFLGNLRIIEGVAVNSATYPIAKIMIMGELYDAKGKVIAAKVSYGGNIVSDERLAGLSEEEIKSALSIPQGSDLSNNRIPPGGKIPFMIVFAREPAGVVKTTIMPLSADRLAP